MVRQLRAETGDSHGTISRVAEQTIPMDLTEAAMVDGASVWRQYWQIILPLCRPPMAALATLLFTWIYNDFFWPRC